MHSSIAQICLIKELYNLSAPVEFVHATEAVKIFCCAGRNDCKESVMEMRRFKRLKIYTFVFQVNKVQLVNEFLPYASSLFVHTIF